MIYQKEIIKVVGYTSWKALFKELYSKQGLSMLEITAIINKRMKDKRLIQTISESTLWRFFKESDSQPRPRGGPHNKKG